MSERFQLTPNGRGRILLLAFTIVSVVNAAFVILGLVLGDPLTILIPLVFELFVGVYLHFQYSVANSKKNYIELQDQNLRFVFRTWLGPLTTQAAYADVVLGPENHAKSKPGQPTTVSVRLMNGQT